MSPLELLGYAASVLVAASLTLKSIVRLRVVNLLGAVCFTIYGALLGAWPVALVNGVIVLINVWHLTQMASAREYFRLLEVGPDSEYLREFLRFHARDISHFLPEFDEKLAEFISIPLVVLAVWFTAQHIKKKVHRAARDGHEL